MTCPSNCARSAVQLSALLRGHLADPRSSWSIGRRGAIAEFHRDPDEVAEVSADGWIVRTARGAIQIHCDVSGLKPIVYQRAVRGFSDSQYEVSFSVPAGETHPLTIEEVGPDASSIHPACKMHRLFDLGLTGGPARACIRTSERDLQALLRQVLQQRLFDLPCIAEQLRVRSPHRVFVSPLGRIEVYQAIPDQRTPAGPHTHILPELLTRDDRDEPIEPGYALVGQLYPFATPERSRQFEVCLAPAFAERKRAVTRSIEKGAGPPAQLNPLDMLDAHAMAVAAIETGRRGAMKTSARAWCDLAQRFLARK